MILRYDRVGIELPQGDPDPAGAMAVQELMGGRFGEMSTLMNYTFQSFNFRDRDRLRPFYDLVANIAAEEYGHIELVGATIGAMLGGAETAEVVTGGNPHHVLKGGKGVLPVDSGGLPWTGDYVFSSGDLVEDLTHNYFLETGARNGKLKVYEAVDHPAPRPADPDGQDPRVQAASRGRPAPHALPLLPERLQGGRRRLQGPAPRDRRGPRGRGRGARGLPVAGGAAGAGRVRPGLRARRDRGDRPAAPQGSGARLR
jgi:hypothetical protein